MVGPLLFPSPEKTHFGDWLCASLFPDTRLHLFQSLLVANEQETTPSHLMHKQEVHSSLQEYHMEINTKGQLGWDLELEANRI